jgi:hypothetical protein
LARRELEKNKCKRGNFWEKRRRRETKGWKKKGRVGRRWP